MPQTVPSVQRHGCRSLVAARGALGDDDLEPVGVHHSFVVESVWN